MMGRKMPGEAKGMGKGRGQKLIFYLFRLGEAITSASKLKS